MPHQDVAQALHELPAPRVLVTTPVHLRALIESATVLPALQFVLSATAPLTEQLAGACESAWGAPVLEIYGSTETGGPLVNHHPGVRERLNGAEVGREVGAGRLRKHEAVNLLDSVQVEQRSKRATSRKLLFSVSCGSQI